MSGYVALTSYADRIQVLNDIQSIITLMRTWNNDAQRVEQYLSTEGLDDATIQQNIANALRGMGPGTDLTTSNYFNQYLKSNIDGNFNTADHRYWLPSDPTLPYSRGLSWAHSYPNPVKIKTREAESFFMSPGNSDLAVAKNLYWNDTTPIAGTGVSIPLYYTGPRGATYTQAATGLSNVDPYFAVNPISTNYNLGTNWTASTTYHTISANGAEPAHVVETIGAKVTTATRYDVYIKVDSISAGGFKVMQGGNEFQDAATPANAKTADTAGWHWFSGLTSGTGQFSIVPTSALTCTISEIKISPRLAAAAPYGSSTVGWAGESASGRTTQDNCSFIAARKMAQKTVTNAFGTPQPQVALSGYPFSDFKEDTSYNNDDVNWDGDIIEIVGGPPDTSHYAIVREVLWDPISLRRGAAIRVQQLYDTGTSVLLKSLSYPVTVSEPTEPEPTNAYFNCAGMQIFRRFTYVRT